ncbi:glutamate-cysteine ligase family protein [Actinophytocola sp.]|uniref:glutamate-cysteine ligase family protein n=1 Tax=Actinophytocola sp. TaxID=1872138 RepID=UPI002D651A37|nr:glutamate-cysteine ligase family protein [Actinophytocola sp.]HYQ61853.1 glutamate-cysteine ligase family protein [Actinophytocola sp.]
MGTALMESVAAEWIELNAFPHHRVGRIGVELEFLVEDHEIPRDRVNLTRLRRALDSPGALPAGGSVSFEPGGQVELSTRPAGAVAACVSEAAADLSVLRDRAGRDGLRLRGAGLDERPPARTVDLAWYAALERSYDLFGPWGRVMMCNAAAVQVSLDLGDDSTGWRGRNRRWLLANRLGPVLVAMFANSPDLFGLRARSTRQLIRFRTDPTRTDPVPWSGDVRADWTRYLLDARIVGIQGNTPSEWTAPPVGLTLRRWLRDARPRAVYEGDLRRHLKSMIPPVRACGRMELRMIDAQHGDDWVVPVVVAAYLLDDERGFAQAETATRPLPVPTRGDYLLAAREGLSVPRLADVAARCMRSVLRGLDGLALPDWAAARVCSFADRYTLRGVSPADLCLVTEGP